jgi:hypothetical protein
MLQVIIHQSPSGLGNVAVCIPTGEIAIDEVLNRVKLEYPEAIIVDANSLPTDNEFFNAWELLDGQVVVNEAKKQAIIDAKQAVIDAKASALAKLAALGLTQDEIKTLVG